MLDKKYFVICGNDDEFFRFIKKKTKELYDSGETGITYSHFTCVKSLDVLRGYANPSGYFIGSWRNRTDLKEIFQQLIIATNDSYKKEYLIRIMNDTGV